MGQVWRTFYAVEGFLNGDEASGVFIIAAMEVGDAPAAFFGRDYLEAVHEVEAAIDVIPAVVEVDAVAVFPAGVECYA